MKEATCRGAGCGQAIGFIVTTAGRHMPVDPELVTLPLARPAIPGAPRQSLVTPEGQLISGTPDPSAAPVTGYVPHWGTCPARKEFKA